MDNITPMSPCQECGELNCICMMSEIGPVCAQCGEPYSTTYCYKCAQQQSRPSIDPVAQLVKDMDLCSSCHSGAETIIKESGYTIVKHPPEFVEWRRKYIQSLEPAFQAAVTKAFWQMGLEGWEVIRAVH